MSYDRSVVPAVLNPPLTAELDQEVRLFLKWGYLVVDDAVTADQVEMLRGRSGRHVPPPGGGVHAPVAGGGRPLRVPARQPAGARRRITAILGTCVQLHSATARVTRPGEPDQDWHRDGPWAGRDPDGTPIGSTPGQINCGYYLDELTADNGPIAIVPGSQRAPFRPPKGHPEFPDQLLVLAKPGQAVLFNGWLYHRGVANRSDRARRVCLMCYQNAWMKSREPFDGPRVSDLREHGTALQKLLLGAVPNW